MQEHIEQNPICENDFLLYGIPLSESILSRPIYVFDENLSGIPDLFQMARAKNKKVVVFEDGANIYDFCFQNDTDILMNPDKENGYSWNILKDFDNDYSLLTQILTEKSDEKDLKNTQRYLMTVFINMNNIFSEVNVKNALNAIMFAPMKNAAKTLSRVLDLDSRNYSDIRTDLMIHNAHLALLLNDKDNVAIRDYVSDKSYDGKIMFVSCFNDAKMKEIMKLIVNCCSVQEILTIHDTGHAKTKKTIIIGDNSSQAPKNDVSIIAKYEAVRANKAFDRVFENIRKNETPTPQILAKMYGVSEIIAKP